MIRMPNLDMTETTISVPRYVKARAELLAKAWTEERGRYVPQKEVVSELVNNLWKKHNKNL